MVGFLGGILMLLIVGLSQRIEHTGTSAFVLGVGGAISLAMMIG